MSPWRRKLISYALFLFLLTSPSFGFCSANYRPITWRHQVSSFSKGYYSSKFRLHFMSRTAQRASLCFSKTLKKIANLSLSQIEIGLVQRNIPCVSACICSNDALPSLVQLNQELQYYSGVDTPFFYTTNTIRTFLDNLCLTLTWWKPFIKITMQF